MKKFTLFLSALLISAMSFAAEAWVQVTDASTLAVGDQVVIVAAESDLALSTEQRSNNRGQVAITKVGNTVEISETVQILTLETGNVDGTWALKTENGYLFAASSSSNYLRTEETLSDNSSWKITIADGLATIIAQGENERNLLRHNEQSSIFSCYKSGQKDIALYKKTTIEGVYVTPPTITGAADFKYYTDVKIAANEGLTIYYTTDGTEPAKDPYNEYWGSFTIEETTTVKAIAYDEEGNASAVVEKTFKEMELVTCEEAVALCATTPAEKYIVRGYVTSIEKAYDPSWNNISFWIADTKNGGEVLQAYRAIPTTDADITVAVGDYVEVIGNLVLYGSTPEVNAGGTYTVANLVWAGDEREGYLISGLDPEYGELAINLAYVQQLDAWFLSMAINGERVAEYVTLEDEPTFDEEENLILQTTIVTEDETEYELDLTVAKDAAVVINVTDATMAMSDNDWEVGTMYVSGTWNGYNVKVQLNGWTYYGYGEYEDAGIEIEDDNKNTFMSHYAPVTIEKKENGTAVVTSEFCYYSETLKFYELNVTVAQAVEHEIEKVTIECNVVFDIEEEYVEWEDATYQYPYLSGTCDLGEIRVDLWHEQVGRAIDSLYGEWGWTEEPNWDGGTMLVASVGVEITPEAQGEEWVYPLTLDLLQGTVATYTKGEPNTFQGVFLGSDWKEYTLKLTEVAKPSAVDNITTTVAPVKMIQNGQLVIIRNGVKYNVQGAVIK